MVRPWCPHFVRCYPRLIGAFFFGNWVLKAAESLLAPTWSLVDGKGWKPVDSLSRLSYPLCRRCGGEWGLVTDVNEIDAFIIWRE